MTSFTLNRTFRRAGLVAVTGAALALGLTSRATTTPASADTAPGEAKPVLNLLCKYSNDTTPVANLRTPASVQSRFTNSFPGLDHYFREMSAGKINLTGTQTMNWATLPNTQDGYAGDLDAVFRDCVAASHQNNTFTLGGFTITNIWLQGYNGASTGGRYGSGAVDGIGWPQATWMNISLDQGVVAHEMSHAFGLGHTTNDPFDVLSNPYYGWMYGFDSNVAGMGRMGQGLAAPQRDLLGWIPAGRAVQVTDSTTRQVTLQSLSQPGSTGNLLAKVYLGSGVNSYYTAELRRKSGYDQALPGEGVVIHKIGTGQYSGRTLMTSSAVMSASSSVEDAGAVWTAGETFTGTESGTSVSIKVDAVTATTATLTITRTGPSVVLPETAGPVPTNVQVSSAVWVDYDNDYEPVVSWTAPRSGLTYYTKVQGPSGGPSIQPAPYGQTRSTLYITTPGTYQVSVQSCLDGNYSSCGDFSAPVTVTVGNAAPSPTPTSTPSPTATPTPTATPSPTATVPATPSAVTNFRTTAVRQTGVDLAWDGDSNAGPFFRIGRRSVGSNAWREMSYGSGRTFTDGGLVSGASYEYRIESCNTYTCNATVRTLTVTTTSAATPTPTSTPSPTATPAPTSTPAPTAAPSGSAPATPANLRSTAQTGGSVTLAFDASAGATSYKVQYQKYSGGPVTETTVSSTSPTISGLASGTWYTFKVAACNGNSCSAFSAGVMAITAVA